MNVDMTWEKLVQLESLSQSTVREIYVCVLFCSLNTSASEILYGGVSSNQSLAERGFDLASENINILSDKLPQVTELFYRFTLGEIKTPFHEGN